MATKAGSVGFSSTPLDNVQGGVHNGGMEATRRRTLILEVDVNDLDYDEVLCLKMALVDAARIAEKGPLSVSTRVDGPTR
jgi:hypothetical protein